MKLRNQLLVFLMGLCLISCSGESENVSPVGPDGEQDVLVRIDYNGEIKGKSITDPSTGTEAEVLFNAVMLVFCDESTVYKVVELTHGSDMEEVTTDGKRVTGIDPQADNILVIGNHQAKEIDYSSVASIKASSLSATVEQNMSNVTLYGEGALRQNPTVSNGVTVYRPEITIVPQVSRFEIGKISCSDLGNRYAGITLKSIGLTDFVTSRSLDGSSSSLLLKWGSVRDGVYSGNIYEPGTPPPGDGSIDPFYIWGDTPVIGWSNDPIQGGVELRSPSDFYPTDDKVFSYNFFPTAQFPSIRLELLDVESVNPNETIDFRWVRTSGFGNVTPELGNIYKVDLKFREENVGPWNPGDALIVEVSVSVRKWEIKMLDPSFD